MLEAYAAGINRFASLHPKQVRHSELFPVTPIDIVTAYNLSMMFISNMQSDLGRLFSNKIDPMTLEKALQHGKGSNGIALAPHKTKEGKAFLVSNSHQPLRSYLSWYEVHIATEEGWNFTGATFAGGLTPFVGTNEHLGWTHCVNYNDYTDVFELKMHPKNKLQYRFDGKWKTLEERVWKGKVKLGFLTLGVRRVFYWSDYGPVVKNKSGFFAMRFPANMVIGAPEQWYHMNKAQNLEEFKAAMEAQQHPNLSTVYADKVGNILFIDNGLFPYRNPNYNWRYIVPGDTSATLWPIAFMPMDSILMIENPSSGYVFHMNSSGFNSTAPVDQKTPNDFDPTIGYLVGDNPRTLRFQYLMQQYDKMSYEDLKRVKYDRTHLFPLYTRTIPNWELLRELSPEKHPDLADIITVFKRWDGNGDADNLQAAIYMLSGEYIIEYQKKTHTYDRNWPIPKHIFPKALRHAKRYLLNNFGRLEVPLGKIQKHVRGDKVLPYGGLAETISTTYSIPWKRGMRQSNLGDSFILFATYGENGVEKIETINCYGASNHPDSPHYTDQMDLFVQQKTKPMTLDKAKILAEAKQTYHPR